MLEVICYPNPILRKVAEDVLDIDDEIKTLAREMFETMYEYIGIGLAAPQVGVSLRLVVIDLRENDELNQRVFINPVITYKSKEKERLEEGCLSLPEISASVSRPARIKVTALGLDGKEFELEAEGLLARCIQHEVDHLDGILFTDKVSLASKLSVKGGLRHLEEVYMDEMEYANKKDAK